TLCLLPSALLALSSSLAACGGDRSGQPDTASKQVPSAQTSAAAPALSGPAPGATASASAPAATAGPSMVKIPGGTFKLGRDDGKKSEGPSHEVTVKDFELDVFEVTVADYKACVDAK